MTVRWLNILGLVCDMAGAVLMALGVIASRRHIDEMTRMIAGHNPAERADRRHQSNLAIAGLALLVLGFVLQIVASVPWSLR